MSENKSVVIGPICSKYEITICSGVLILGLQKRFINVFYVLFVILILRPSQQLSHFMDCH